MSLRGAVSIARRLQDPLAELVKIDPKSIGVGQYQHDVGQTQLARSLDAVVEDCVNAVGVDVNTASAPLLARVSGLNASVAQSIVSYRDMKGMFASRAALRAVPRLGDKTFEQAAGFLRVMGGDNPLDASAVHPESYPLVEKILADIKKDVKGVIGDGKLLKSLNPAKYADEKFGVPTISDILKELEKPGRDPRPEFVTATFKEGVEQIARPAPRHDPGRRGHQRRRVWRLRRYRRAPGWPGAYFRAVEHLRQGSAHGGESRPGGEGESAGSRRKAQAHRADHAPVGHAAAAGAPAPQRGDRNDAKRLAQHQQRAQPAANNAMAAAFAKLKS